MFRKLLPSCVAVGQLVLGVLVFSASLAAQEREPPQPVNIAPAVVDEQGVRVHSVRSEYQAGETLIRVLLPADLQPEEKLPVVYLLPVEANSEARYGDGLKEILQQKLHQQHRAIYVAPTFSHLPWYADHPTDRAIRQESYLLRVVPWIEANYPARAEAAGRLLLGFSKSGWGAWSLLLRHPDTFCRAAAWDAPLMMTQSGLYGNGPIFGTNENFQRYQISELLASAKLGEQPRLILTGSGNFRQHHQQMHARLQELRIPHIYRDGPPRKHDWHSGWVAETLELLLAPEK